MSDKTVIGMSYTDNGYVVKFYIQGDYDEDFARDLAESINLAKDTEKGAFIATLLSYVLGDTPNARIAYTLPENNHTLHFVDIDNGKVTLHSADGYDFKVGFSFDEFVKRYDL